MDIFWLTIVIFSLSHHIEILIFVGRINIYKNIRTTFFMAVRIFNLIKSTNLFLFRLDFYSIYHKDI